MPRSIPINSRSMTTSAREVDAMGSEHQRSDPLHAGHRVPAFSAFNGAAHDTWRRNIHSIRE
jgi:hypothetical protein